MKRVAAFLTGLLGTVLVVALAITVPFVVAQPIVWRALFDESPPATTQDLAQVISISLVIVTLALGGIGVFIYRVIWSRLEDGISGGIEEAEAAVQKTVSEQLEDNIAALTEQMEKHRSSVDRAVTDGAQRMNDAYEETVAELAAHEGNLLANLAFFYLENAYEQWISYSRQWMVGADESVPAASPFDARVSSAVRYSTKALEFAEAAVAKGAEVGALVSQARNALAFHLATRRRADDKEKVLELVRLLRAEPKQTSHVRETVAWALLSFVDPPDPLYFEARGIVDGLLADASVDEMRREEIRTRYARKLELIFEAGQPGSGTSRK